MSSRLAIPLMTSCGDADKDTTYAGVGRVTSAWEGVEYGLSRLCEAFLMDESKDGMRVYGNGTIFKNRLSILADCAAKFFVYHCNQEIEHIFCEITRIATELSTFRHEVAHGMVFEISGIKEFAEHLDKSTTPPHYAVVAPYYACRHHGIDGLPKFSYSSYQLELITTAMQAFMYHIDDYRESILSLYAQRQERP